MTTEHVVIGGEKKKDKNPKNIYNIFIQNKDGNFESGKIKEDMDIQTINVKYKNKEYKIKTDGLLPKDYGIFTQFMNYIFRKKINQEYSVLFQEDSENSVQYPDLEEKGGNLLWVVMNNSTAQRMLSSLFKKEGSFLGGFNWKMGVMVVAGLGISVFVLNYFGILHWW